MVHLNNYKLRQRIQTPKKRRNNQTENNRDLYENLLLLNTTDPIEYNDLRSV